MNLVGDLIPPWIPPRVGGGNAVLGWRPEEGRGLMFKVERGSPGGNAPGGGGGQGSSVPTRALRPAWLPGGCPFLLSTARARPCAKDRCPLCSPQPCGVACSFKSDEENKAHRGEVIHPKSDLQAEATTPGMVQAAALAGQWGVHGWGCRVAVQAPVFFLELSQWLLAFNQDWLVPQFLI